MLTDATYTKVKDGVYLIHTSIKFEAGAIYETVIGVLTADGMMTIRPDTYYFDQKNPFNANSLKEFVRLVVRDAWTTVEAFVNGFGEPYRIEFTGSIPVPKGVPK